MRHDERQTDEVISRAEDIVDDDDIVVCPDCWCGESNFDRGCTCGCHWWNQIRRD